MPNLGGGYAANREVAKSKADEGIGSREVGYASPKDGPFKCSHCVHFKAPNSCDHPKVIADPEVKGKVEPEGCCNYYRNALRK